jgi:hypothetical protein
VIRPSLRASAASSSAIRSSRQSCMTGWQHCPSPRGWKAEPFLWSHLEDPRGREQLAAIANRATCELIPTKPRIASSTSSADARFRTHLPDAARGRLTVIHHPADVMAWRPRGAPRTDRRDPEDGVRGSLTNNRPPRTTSRACLPLPPTCSSGADNPPQRTLSGAVKGPRFCERLPIGA